MTIGAYCCQIIDAIILSIAVFMMNLKHAYVFIMTYFTTYFTKRFVCICKAFDNIIVRSFNSIMYGRTFSRTKSSSFPVHFVSTGYNITTCNTWFSLCAFNGAIFSFSAKFVSRKLIVARFACTNFLFSFIRTCSRAIFLFNTTFTVVQLKRCITNKTVAHGAKYAIT